MRTIPRLAIQIFRDRTGPLRTSVLVSETGVFPKACAVAPASSVLSGGNGSSSAGICDYLISALASWREPHTRCE
jgi:hypothetical protein